MYLRLWSQPAGAALFDEKGLYWTQIDGFPVYRLPIQTTGPRAIGLLRSLLKECGEELQQFSPQALYLGSARGEIEMLIQAVEGWKENGSLSPILSPMSSFGTLATLIAREIGIEGPAVLISQACISGLLALYQARLFLRAGEGKAAIFGAVEAPLTPFFVQVMARLRIYTAAASMPYVRPGSSEGRNTFALGEGVALGILSLEPISPFYVEELRIHTAPAREGVAFTAVDRDYLESLLQTMKEPAPDFVVLHAPGTKQGDLAEWQAVQAVWGEVPVVSPKAYIGHSLGAAPLLGLAAALHLMQTEDWPPSLYSPFWSTRVPPRRERAVVIGLAYGGAMGAIRLRYGA
ncbi:MAG: beta-ketoacyl synthase N-terminal-like domain-containing protein [Bacteroidia bacterium]|nr:hypothetical protein [Bacteroidia bacterium]MDW8015795.1 beta-ketoacyl synthase N-terminal-like domain-containing protein [Bacteroidia bacterium]